MIMKNGKEKTAIKRITSFILSVLMVFGLFAGIPVSANDIPTLDEWIANTYDTISAGLSSDLIPRYGSNGKFIAPIELITDYKGWIAISDRAGLENIKNNLNGKYYLTADIDLSGEEWVPIGDSRAFCGTFDGQGYVIRNLTIGTATTPKNVEYAGLFGSIGNATIKNVGLEKTYINISASSPVTASSYTGGICGYSYGITTINNCYNTGNISASASSPVTASSYTGGICGRGYGTDTTISNCYNTGDVYASASNSTTSTVFASAGGICGDAGVTTISNCYNTGNVFSAASTTSTAASRAGGICGYGYNAAISNCYNTGNVCASVVAGSSTSSSDVGGICGKGYNAAISNCYNTGNISASASNSSDSYAGGICGNGGSYGYNVTISNCYNTGAVAYAASDSSNANFSSTGGICGYGYNTTISNCYNTGAVASAASDSSNANFSSRAGGICGDGYHFTISNCYNTGAVSASAFVSSSYRSSSFAGGICGDSDGTTVSNCYNTGAVSASASDSSDSSAGGICGYGGATTNMSNCYNIGVVSASAASAASSSAGGICGYSHGDTISNCYNIGAVSASAESATSSSAGGICGYGYNTTISNCYWNIDSPQEVKDSPVAKKKGVGNGTDTTTPLTPEEMRSQSSFEEWDFINVWAIDPAINDGFPYLRHCGGGVVKPPSNPTISNFAVTPNSVALDRKISVSGVVNGNGKKIKRVEVNVLDGEPLWKSTDTVENLNVDTIDLSTVSALQNIQLPNNAISTAGTHTIRVWVATEDMASGIEVGSQNLTVEPPSGEDNINTAKINNLGFSPSSVSIKNINNFTLTGSITSTDEIISRITVDIKKVDGNLNPIGSPQSRQYSYDVMEEYGHTFEFPLSWFPIKDDRLWADNLRKYITSNGAGDYLITVYAKSYGSDVDNMAVEEGKQKVSKKLTVVDDSGNEVTHTEVTKVDDGKGYFYVYDYETGLPIPNVRVAVRHPRASSPVEHITDKNGYAIFEKGEINIDNEKYAYLSVKENVSEEDKKYSDLISTDTYFPKLGELEVIPLSKIQDKPNITQVFFYSQTMKSGEKLLSESKYINENLTDSFELKVYGDFYRPSASVSEYKLILEGGEEIASVKVNNMPGVFKFNGLTSVQTGKKLVKGKKIYIQAIGSLPEKKCPGDITLINLSITDESTIKNGNMNINFADLPAVDVPAEVPFIGNNKFKLDLGQIGAICEVEGNKFKIGIGIEDDTKDKIGDKWNNWKDFVSDPKAFSGYSIYNIKNKNGAGWFGTKTPIKPIYRAYGFIEGIIENGKLKTIEGKLKIEIGTTFGISYQGYIYVVPVVIGVKGEIIGGYDGGIGYDFINEKFLMTGKLSASAKLELSLGVGLKDVLSGGVYGSAKLETSYNLIELNKNKVNLKLTGEVGLYAQVLIFSYKKSYTPPTPNNVIWDSELGWFPNNSPRSLTSLQNNPAYYMDEIYNTDDYSTSSRDYLSNQSAWFGNRRLLRSLPQNCITTLQSSVYTETAPLIAQAGDKRIMVFLADDGTRDIGNPQSLNRTKLVYSIYNPLTNTWEEPIAVYDDGAADFYPNIYSDGTDIYVTWHKSNQVFANNATIDDLCAAAEIYVAKFDTATNTFVNVTRLTDNSTLDTQPKIAVSNGKAFIAWVNNADNNIFGTIGKNSIMVRELQSNGTWNMEKELFGNLNSIINMEVSYFNGEPVVAYIVDKDNDLETIDDRDLKVVNLDSTSTTVAANTLVSNIQFADILGEKTLNWYNDGNISYTAHSDFTIIQELFEEPKSGLFDDYKIISDGLGNTTILFSSSEDEIGGVYGYSYDMETGKWSESVRLLETGDYARFVDGIYDNNSNLYLAFNKANVVIGEDGIIESNDLCVATIIPQCDITVSNAAYSPFDVEPGKELPIVFDIKNNGQTKVSSLSVKVTSGQQAISTFDLNQTILPGETVTVDTAFTLPSSITEQTEFMITVEPQNQTDINMGDNSSTIIVGYADLSLNIDNSYYSGNNMITTVSVENVSDYNANAQLTIRKGSPDGEILKTIDLGEIDVNSKSTLLINAATEIFDFEDTTKEALYFEVVCDKYELLTANNSDFVVVNAPSYIINVDVSGGGTVIGNGGYKRDSDITLIATPNLGYVFDGWYENGKKIENASAIYTFTVTANITLEAKFILGDSYSKYFKDGFVADYTIIDGYIVGGINAGDMVEDFMSKLADGVNVYKDNALVTSGKLGTGMVIRHEADNSEITVVIKGDLNGDGRADIADAQIYLESLVGNTTLDGAYALAVKEYDDSSALKNLRRFLNDMSKN